MAVKKVRAPAPGKTPKKTKTAPNKTRETTRSVAKFLAGQPDARRPADCLVVHDLMRRVTGVDARMWGTSIVGFGIYHYKYESGREGDMPRTGFSPRKEALTLYIMGGFPRHAALMEELGTYKTGKSCLYIKRLADVNLKILEQLIRESWRYMARRYPEDS